MQALGSAHDVVMPLVRRDGPDRHMRPENAMDAVVGDGSAERQLQGDSLGARRTRCRMEGDSVAVWDPSPSLGFTLQLMDVGGEMSESRRPSSISNGCGARPNTER